MPGLIRLAVVLAPLLFCANAWAQEYPVSITSDPEGAEVYIDDTEGEPIGVTPFKAKLEAGDYTLIIELDGYEPAVESLTVKKRRRGQKLRVSLDKQPTGFLVLAPAEAGEDFEGATVLIDGSEREIEKGVPFELPAGAHQVEVVRKGYKTYEAWIEVTEGGTNSVAVNFIEGEDEDDDDDAFGGGSSKKKKKKKKGGGDDGPIDLGGLPQFQLTLGVEYGGRFLRYPEATTNMIRPTYTLLGSRLRFTGAAYPLAKKSKALGGLGIGATFGVLVFPRESQTETGANSVATNWFDIAVDLRYRYAFSGKFYVIGSVGYALETFSYADDDVLGDSLSPSAYRQIEVSGTVGGQLGSVHTYFGLSFPYVSSAGGFADDRFNGPAVTAFGVMAGGYKRVYKKWDLGIHVTYSYYSIEFGEPKDAAISAESAVDQYFGLMAGVGYRL